MSLHDTASRFEQSEAGTDDFKRLYKEAFELMNADRENAALYFVLGVAAHSYVVQYEDQAVTAELAGNAKLTLVSFCRKISQALASDPRSRLQLAGELACEYQFDVHAF